MPVIETLFAVAALAAELLDGVDVDSVDSGDLNIHGNPTDVDVHGNGPQNVHGNDPTATVHGGRPTDWWGRPV